MKLTILLYFYESNYFTSYMSSLNILAELENSNSGLIIADYFFFNFKGIALPTSGNQFSPKYEASSETF